MKPTLIVDADDTLWENNIFYEQCIADFASLMAAHGFEPEEALHTLEIVERERIPLVGYAPQEFARSLVTTYRRLCAAHDRPAEDGIAHSAWQIGQRVVEYPIVLLDGVAETLTRLRGHCRLFLLTKGSREAQESKLARSGLGQMFEAVHIVLEKNAQVLREVLAQHGLQPQETWMVGNSPRSDINPALEAGIGAIYVPHPHTWRFEVEEITEPEHVTVLERFADLLTLFHDL